MRTGRTRWDVRVGRRHADRYHRRWVDVVFDPCRERNVGDEIVCPSVAVAIGASGNLRDDAACLGKGRARLAETYAPQRLHTVEHHQTSKKRSTSGAQAVTGDDAGLDSQSWLELLPKSLEAVEKTGVNWPKPDMFKRVRGRLRVVKPIPRVTDPRKTTTMAEPRSLSPYSCPPAEIETDPKQ